MTILPFVMQAKLPYLYQVIKRLMDTTFKTDDHIRRVPAGIGRMHLWRDRGCMSTLASRPRYRAEFRARFRAASRIMGLRALNSQPLPFLSSNVFT